MPTDRELDQLIDAALPSYSAAKPPSGFEDRILSRTFAESSPQRGFPWIWAITLPATACLLIVAALLGRNVLHRSTSATNPSTNTRTSASPSFTSSPSDSSIATKATPIEQPKPTHLRHTLAAQAAPNEPLPKQEVFPSASPLTADEQSLIAYNPARLHATITHNGTLLETNPLIISELQIAPLDIPALDPPASDASESGRNNQQP
jgi:hypothetical protein